jgi:type I restriction enzyme S subunit
MNRTATAFAANPYERNIKQFSLTSNWLYEEDSRFDATTYAEAAFSVLASLKASRLPKELLGTLCGTIWHPVQNQARSNFKRIYTKAEHGVGFVSSRSMFAFPQRPEKFLSKRMPKLADLMVPEGWLLVSRSGTVGNVLLVNRTLAALAITDHAIRVEPAHVFAGYLYAFMASRFGQPLIARGIYGSTVDELEPKHIARIPVPLLPREMREDIHTRIVQAYDLRAEANAILDLADKELHDAMGVSPFTEDDIEYLGAQQDPRAFGIASTDLGSRFDATNHIPIVRSVHHKLEKGAFRLIRLGDTDTRIFQPGRFKRIYVEDAVQGVPFFQPSYVSLFRANQNDFISRKANASELGDCMLKENSILITRSGTAGKACLVTGDLTGWAGSDDLIRLFPETQFDPGYLTAFFLTPFARHQVLAQLYGGVVDHVDVEHVANVLCPDVPIEKQKIVGAKVGQAYKKKDEANSKERETVAELEQLIHDSIH